MTNIAYCKTDWPDFKRGREAIALALAEVHYRQAVFLGYFFVKIARKMAEYREW